MSVGICCCKSSAPQQQHLTIVRVVIRSPRFFKLCLEGLAGEYVKWPWVEQGIISRTLGGAGKTVLGMGNLLSIFSASKDMVSLIATPPMAAN